MENTGIGWEKEEFVSRKNYEEFFRDGKVIQELFLYTRGVIHSVDDISSDDLTLCVFNHAYRICWMIVNKKAVVESVYGSVMFGNEMVRKHSWAVAYTLFRLHEEHYPSMRRARMDFTRSFSVDLYKRRYSGFVRGRSLSHPINFRAPSFTDSELLEEVDFSKVKCHVTAALNKAIKLEAETENLRKQLEEERYRRKTAEETIEEKQAKLNCWENDAFYKAVNINSILKYAQDRGNCDNSDIKTIRMMLLALCANKVPNDVIEAIKTLKLGGNITIGEQHNHGCQQFYGNITDSEFPSK